MIRRLAGVALPAAVIGLVVALLAPPNGFLAERMWLFVLLVIAITCRVVDPVVRQPGETPLLALISLGGVYACVPETDHIRFAALALMIVAIIDWRRPDRLGAFAPGYEIVLLGVASVVIVNVAAFSGGVYRDGSLVGSAVALGLLLAEPVTSHVVWPPSRRSRRNLSMSRRFILRVAVQGGVALGVSRTSGLNDSVVKAAPSAAFWILLVAMAAVLINGGKCGRISNESSTWR